MKDPKRQSMPLTTAMVRLMDVMELVKAKSITDEVLKDLCEDYRLARETLAKLRRTKPRRTAEMMEYTTLVAELEDEIMRRLLGGDGSPKV